MLRDEGRRSASARQRKSYSASHGFRRARPDQGVDHPIDAAAVRDGNEQRRSIECAIRNCDNLGHRCEFTPGRRAKAGEAQAPNLDFPDHGVRRRPRDHEHGQSSWMIRALGERQSRNDFGCRIELERTPPGAVACDVERGHECQVSFRVRHCRDRARSPHVRHKRDGEAEMKPRRIAHHGFPGGKVGVHRERCLDIGEGRDDDAPDTLGGIERQDTPMARHQAPHHLGLPCRPKRRA